MARFGAFGAGAGTISMKEKNYIHARTCVYNMNYHIVWTTKYRRKVLTSEIDDYLQKLLKDIGMQKGFEVRMWTNANQTKPCN